MRSTLPRLSLLVAACALLVACDAPQPTPSAPVEGQIPISAVPGPAVDRPRLDPVTPDVAGLVAGLPGGDLGPYLEQELDWTDCGDNTECADVLAPLDYADPAARAVTLSLRRKPASAQPRLGSLFVNPGGPGASGKDLAARFAADGLEQYDIVGWDPRGTGDSTPVRCLTDAEADVYTSLDSSPETDAERVALIQAQLDFGEACWERNGALLEHISTIETVRDLDLLRRLVGDEELHYLGYSYGTQVGATYAELFGQHTGRLVLDAAVDITDDQEVIQAMGFDLALGNFAQWCADQQCRLGTDRQQVLSTITGLFDRLDGRPLQTGERSLTQSLAVTGTAAMLYGGEDAWPTLAAAVDAAVRGNGSGLLWGADVLNSRDEEGHYDAMFYAFPAISCLDDGTERGVLDADRLWQEDQRKAPVFGRYFGPQYGCSLWPVRPARQLDLRGADAAPLLVIGGTGDNATPYQQAVTMAEQLESGVLVTYEGEGHGAYGGKSECVDRIVVDYLVDGTLPEDGTRCT